MLAALRRPNIYAGSPLDRAAERREDAGWIAARLEDASSLFVPVWRGKSALQGVEGRPEAVFLTALPPQAGAWAFLGLLDGHAVFAAGYGGEEPPALPDAQARFEDLRSARGALAAGEASILAHARALLHWRGRHRFCGVCGSACEPRSAGHVLACTGCGAQHFPRTDPAVIMLVERGDRCLLGHSQRFPNSTMYSTLAGFVEPGESLEEAVAREVLEESGIRVGAVRYHSSQPWPFPGNLMLGFYAEALNETITIDPAELADARWFSRVALRDPASVGISLPRGDSIARRLIEDWLEG